MREKEREREREKREERRERERKCIGERKPSYAKQIFRDATSLREGFSEWRRRRAAWGR